MSNRFDNPGVYGNDLRTVLVARFDSADEAAIVQDTLESIFDELTSEVEDLFERNGGEAHALEIAKIYAIRGFRNDSGWEQDIPILVHDRDLAWTLPIGAHVEDAENLLLTLGASDVAIHQQGVDAEEWRTAPHPMIMVVPDDEAWFHEGDDDEPISMVTTRKRTLH